MNGDKFRQLQTDRDDIFRKLRVTEELVCVVSSCLRSAINK